MTEKKNEKRNEQMIQKETKEDKQLTEERRGTEIIMIVKEQQWQVLLKTGASDSYSGRQGKNAEHQKRTKVGAKMHPKNQMKKSLT